MLFILLRDSIYLTRKKYPFLLILITAPWSISTGALEIIKDCQSHKTIRKFIAKTKKLKNQRLFQPLIMKKSKYQTKAISEERRFNQTKKPKSANQRSLLNLP